MAQHLNLLDPSLRPERSWLRATVGLWLLALLLAAALGAGALMRRAADERQQAAAKAEAELSALAASPAVQQDERERNELALLRERLELARLLDQQLEQLPPAQGAAQVLEALAYAGGEDTWLTQVQWEARGPLLNLKGLLLDPRRLPNYLRRLEQQPALRGQRFEQLELDPQRTLASDPLRPEPQPEREAHRFQLRSAKENKP